MSRFDPDPDKPYGNCMDCEEVFADRADMSAHLSETYKAGKSHRGRGTNPTRAERIERELDQIAEDVLYDFVSRTEDLVDRDEVTEEEITEAVGRVTADFADAWSER
ncbi:MAG: hypothetical protein JWP85_2111 [Rhodoglobus sp.]|nr:hypothetical protein [Rhodoglobus sp.]